jgi:hypothetical protein
MDMKRNYTLRPGLGVLKALALAFHSLQTFRRLRHISGSGPQLRDQQHSLRLTDRVRRTVAQSAVSPGSKGLRDLVDSPPQSSLAGYNPGFVRAARQASIPAV